MFAMLSSLITAVCQKMKTCIISAGRCMHKFSSCLVAVNMTVWSTLYPTVYRTFVMIKKANSPRLTVAYNDVLKALLDKKQ